MSGRNQDEESAWVFEDDTVFTAPTQAIFEIWRHYWRAGRLPFDGGWVNQPLSILARMAAIQTVYETMTYKNKEDADWGVLTATQNEIIVQMDKE